MNTLNIISVVIILLFIALFYRAFRKTTLKNIYEQSKNNALIDEKRKEAAKRGQKEFTINNITYFALTHQGALWQHKEFVKKVKKDAKAKLR